MQKCKYADVAKCKTCNVAFHKQCKTFLKYHLATLSKTLQPFTFKRQLIKSPTVWSKDVNKAKSAALQYAMACNGKAVKLTMNQVISLAVANETVEGSVFYIECATKTFGESAEKISSVIKSFIDRVVLSGAKVAVYVAPAAVINLEEYQKL